MVVGEGLRRGAENGGSCAVGCANSGGAMGRFLGLQSTGAGTGWQFENLLCTEAAVTTMAVGGSLV